ncbi:hypothetical protein JZ751_000283, partial [Albula glossodonta]
EFKFMGQSRSPSASPSRQASAANPADISLFEQYYQGGNPFEMQIDNKEEETEDVLASNGYESDELEKNVYQDYDSDSDVPEELKRDYVDEQTGDIPVKSVSRETLRSRKKSDYSLNKVNAPILTNTTLNVIRLVGKYMQMMNILKPIAFDVIHCMSQLFDYYLYAVYTFFGRNDMHAPSPTVPTQGKEQCVARQPAVGWYESSGLGLISSRLRTTLNRIQESLIDMVRETISRAGACRNAVRAVLLSIPPEALGMARGPKCHPSDSLALRMTRLSLQATLAVMSEGERVRET